MCNVDVHWPKLFAQALAQASYSKFRYGKYTGERVTPDSRSGTGENQCSPLARSFVRVFDRIRQFVCLESCYHSSRERKGADHSQRGGTFDFFVRHFKELLKSTFRSIIDGHTDLR